VIRRASRASDQLLFDLKASYMVDVLHMIELPGKRWFVCWQETIADGLRSYAASYAMGTDEPLWKHTFPVPDAGVPLVKDDLAFVTARGLVACIETESGKIRWKLDTLYNPYNQAWQKIEKPVIKDTVVCLTDFPVTGRRFQIDTLWLDIVTGQSVKRHQ
jgi:outer membrane protein assembly factor BamB